MSKNKILVVVLITITIITVIWTLQDEDKVEEPEIIKEEKVEKKEKKVNENKVKIDIKGQIQNPGVYELTNENNVMDAINQAGGLTELSDTSNINLSKKLIDEMVIIIYSKEEIQNMQEKEKITCPPCNDACVKEEDEKGKIEINEEAETDEIININEASKEELQKLKGIGESKANAIIEYREKEGKFETIEDIKNVPGIGESAFEKIKNNIRV